MAEAPVDISRLAGVLNKSKALLDTVETQMGPSGNGGEYSQRGINENRKAPLPNGMVDSSQMLTSLPPGQTPQMTSDPSRPIQRTLKNAKTTKMPKAVVEMMINNPSQDPAAHMGDLDPELVKMINPKGSVPKNPIVENNTTTQVGKSYNKGELKSLIREVVEEIIVEREIDEQVQIRVGDTIFTGKITKSKSINK